MIIIKINRLSSKIIEVPISSTRTNIEVKEYLLYKIENWKYKKIKKIGFLLKKYIKV